MDSRMERRLLGLVDCLGTLCRDLCCKNIERQDHPRLFAECNLRAGRSNLLWFAVFGGTALAQTFKAL